MKEDDLTNELVRKFREDGCQSIEVEAHYNHFGDRGVADMFVQNQGVDRVMELKSHPDKANEVLRQFERMVKYFYKDDDRERPVKSPVYELCFLPSSDNFFHILQNKEMYKSAKDGKEKVAITFRSMDGSNKVYLFPDLEDFEVGDAEWKDYAQENGFKFDRNGDEKEVLNCPYCEKQYTSRGYFRKHIRKCQGEEGVVDKL